MINRNQFAAMLILAAICIVQGCGNRKEQFVYEASASWQEESVSPETAEKQPEQGSGAAAGVDPIPEAQSGREVGDSVIYVYVCGAVSKPGVVSLPAGSRVFEAIEQAGGMLEHAWLPSVNQAAVLVDGQQISVLTKEEAEAQPALTADQAASEGSSQKLVDLNLASAAELTTLPGIGEAKAADIIQYRETVGKFQTIEDIMKISGIKDAVFLKIKDKITVS